MLGLFYVLKLISLFFVFGLLLCFEDQFVLCFISLITRGYVSNISNICYIHNSYKYLSYLCMGFIGFKIDHNFSIFIICIFENSEFMLMEHL